MVSAEQHPLASIRPFRFQRKVSCGLCGPALVASGTGNGFAGETHLLGTVGHRVEVKFSNVIARIMFEAGGDDGVVNDARRESGGKNWERAS